MNEDTLKVLEALREAQQENKELGDSIHWWNNRYNVLYRENKQLKEEIESLKLELKEYDDIFEDAEYLDYEDIS